MSEQQEVRITWLGHATVLIKTAKGTTFLIDPFIAQNPKYPKGFVLPEKIDYILLTHGHGDHISDVVPVAKKHGATVVAIYELAAYVGRKGAEKTLPMNIGGTVQLGDVAVTMVEAKHSAGAEEPTGAVYVGVAAGFVLTIDDGPVLYAAGDTAVFGDMDLLGEMYEPDVALLPIGGHFVMGPREAALATTLLGVGTVLPLHFGTFPQLTGTPEELAEFLGDKAEVVAWKPGESFTL